MYKLSKYKQIIITNLSITVKSYILKKYSPKYPIYTTAIINASSACSSPFLLEFRQCFNERETGSWHFFHFESITYSLMNRYGVIKILLLVQNELMVKFLTSFFMLIISNSPNLPTDN